MEIELDNKLKKDLVGDKPYQRIIGKNTVFIYESQKHGYNLYKDLCNKEDLFSLPSTIVDSEHPWADYMETLLFAVIEALKDSGDRIMIKDIDLMYKLEQLRTKEKILRVQYWFERKSIQNTDISKYVIISDEDQVPTTSTEDQVPTTSTEDQVPTSTEDQVPTSTKFDISVLNRYSIFDTPPITSTEDQVTTSTEDQVPTTSTEDKDLIQRDQNVTLTVKKHMWREDDNIYYKNPLTKIKVLNDETRFMEWGMYKNMGPNWRYLFDQEIKTIEQDSQKIPQMIADYKEMKNGDEFNDEIICVQTHLDQLIERRRKAKDDKTINKDEIERCIRKEEHHFSVIESLIDMAAILTNK
jgi:hypothetical protein